MLSVLLGMHTEVLSSVWYRSSLYSSIELSGCITRPSVSFTYVPDFSLLHEVVQGAERFFYGHSAVPGVNLQTV